MSQEQENIREVEKAMDDHLNDYVRRVFELSQENLISAEKIDTSNLFKTANINISTNEKTIVYPAPYASDVHDGRAEGSMPPVDPLQRWVTRKLGIKNKKKARQAAWAIAVSIKKNGIKETPYLRDAITQSNREFGFEIKEE